MTFNHCLFPLMLLSATASAQTEDPWLWLENIDGPNAMAWVHGQNLRTAQQLEQSKLYRELYDQALEILNSESRIPQVTQRGQWLYNYWRDAEHPRGIYRRTTLEEFRADEPAWETVLDIDALSEQEQRQWVFKGMECLPPEHRQCLVYLSPGGGDAVVMREFDADTRTFVAEGFELPEAKMRVSWRDADSLFVATDFGAGSMTDSGYPRRVAIWQRGTPLEAAEELYVGDPQSVAVGAYRVRMDEGDIDLVYEGKTFWNSEYRLLHGGELRQINLPATAEIEGGYKGRLLISLKEDWTLNGASYPAGAVLIADPQWLVGDDGEMELLIKQAPTQVVENVVPMEQGILVSMLENVQGKLYLYYLDDDGWKRQPVPFPENGAVAVTSTDDESGSFFVRYESFTTPPTLYHVAGRGAAPEPLKAQDATFAGDRFKVNQYFAESADGTQVPYYVVMPKGAVTDGSNPTHIFSYGGFRNALTPSYSGSYEQHFGAYGKLWLERGGVFVLANIRGGGEFGPAWHSAALLKNRHKAFEDFEAVAKDLFARKITSPEHLGIEGRSNGGLLVGAAITRAPELYGAAIIGVPLLDMRRYHQLLAGASWMAEYGDPDDPDMWSYIRTYSPYHNLQADADYPSVFFYTSTRDDRVHPGHARKMAAEMLDQGHDVVYYENTEGGHGGSSTNDQLAHRIALSYAHLWEELK